jgi:VWFA-related protein
MAALPIFAAQPGSTQQNGYSIKSNAELVVLRISARDRQGNFVSDLTKDNFEVYEDGVPQAIQAFTREDVPASVGLIVDNSGSMSGKRADVVTAALDFARSSNTQDEMFVVNFNDTVSFGLPRDTPFTGDADKLQSALSNVVAEGQTALYDAVSYGLQHLQSGTRDRKALIIVSDGGDNVSRHTLDDVMEMTMHSEAVIYTVALFDQNDPDRKPRILAKLAKATGGQAFTPASLADVVPICRRIAYDIRNQYTLSYAPTDEREDGTFRSIKVKVTGQGHGGLIVRTRTGYYAPSSTQTSSKGAVDGAPH